MEANYVQNWQLTSLANKTASYNPKEHSVQVRDAETSVELKSHLQIETWANKSRASDHDRNTLGVMLDTGLTREAESQKEEMRRFEVVTVGAKGAVINKMRTDDPDIAMARFYDLVRNKSCEVGGPGASTALKDMELKLDAGYQYEGMQSFNIRFGKDDGRKAYENIEADISRPAQPTAQTVGKQMPKPDWAQSVEVLRRISNSDRVHIHLPKVGGDYSGKMIAMTDTHLVQRVGKTSAVAHTLDSLSNGQEIARDFDQGKLRHTSQLVIKYGQANEKGLAEVRTYDQSRATQTYKDISEWAQTNITNAKGRETFLKHLQAATQDIANKGKEPARQEPQRQQERQPAPQLQRDR